MPLYDANKKFDINIEKVDENKDCIAGLVSEGNQRNHYECPQFGKGCSPQMPLGAPMVSSEGACAAYYHFSNAMETIS
jgi:hydrogenase expression/formation protein HypD